MKETNDPTEEVRPIVEAALFAGLLDEATEQRDVSLAADPEWAAPRWTHVHTLVTAFMVGVSQADVWHKGYKLPPDFEGVVNWIAFNIQKKWPNDEVVEISLLEARQLFEEWGMEHPSFRKWNETDQLIGISSRYSPTPEARDFIDLGALVHQAVLYLRGQRRLDDDFDRRFEAEHGSCP